jgi:hypothetical protein
MTQHLTPSHQVVQQRSRRNFWLEVTGKWITKAIQDSIFRSIDFNAFQKVVESDIMEAVENWKVKVGLEEPFFNGIHEDNGCDYIRRGVFEGMLCDFEGQGGEPDYECYY